MKEERQRLRLFVCMKARTDGRSCCAHQGASIVLDELRRQILQRGETCSHIDVRPSGCLDRCEDGPVVMAFYGQLAEEATPSRELIKASLDDAAYTFTAVSARDVSEILDTVLEERTCRTGIDVIESLSH
jgi:(2Fe-2S) ferredoxin